MSNFIFVLLLIFEVIMEPSNAQNAQNLTKITWAHAVNSKLLLQEVLDSDIMMIEADIVMGTLLGSNDTTTIPIMGHPPAVTSDLSLLKFLQEIDAFNGGNQTKKGVKLDFKSTEALEKAVAIIGEFYPKIDYPLWINADVLPGPLDAAPPSVDSTRFFTASKNFPKAVLSTGWTTKYGPINNNASYTIGQTQEMLDLLKTQQVVQLVTFPVRAGITANSLAQMQELIDGVPGSTLTIWSSAADYVDVEKLRRVIFQIGLDKVYVDVPKDLMDKLHLDDPLH